MHCNQNLESFADVGDGIRRGCTNHHTHPTMVQKTKHMVHIVHCVNVRASHIIIYDGRFHPKMVQKTKTWFTWFTP